MYNLSQIQNIDEQSEYSLDNLLTISAFIFGIKIKIVEMYG